MTLHTCTVPHTRALVGKLTRLLRAHTVVSGTGISKRRPRRAHTPRTSPHGFKVLSVSSVRPHRSSRVQRPSLNRTAGVRVVCRRGLLRIEGLAVGRGLNPNLSTQRTVLTAVSRRGRYLLREVPDQLEPGVRFRIASDGVAPHGINVLVERRAMLFHRARCQPGWRIAPGPE